MGIIGDALRKWKAKRAEFKEMQRQDKMLKALEERKKSPEEREVESYMEDERQKKIKALAKRLRKKKQTELWNGREGNPAYAENIMRGNKNIFKGKNMFSKMPNIFDGKQDNYFKNHKKLFGV